MIDLDRLNKPLIRMIGMKPIQTLAKAGITITTTTTPTAEEEATILMITTDLRTTTTINNETETTTTIMTGERLLLILTHENEKLNSNRACPDLDNYRDNQSKTATTGGMIGTEETVIGSAILPQTEIQTTAPHSKKTELPRETPALT